MLEVLLVIHLLICLALVGTILLQKSEGGALGIGGGGGFMTGRGAANLLSRTTAMLAMGFFATSLLLTIIGKKQNAGDSVLDKVTIEKKQNPSEGPKAPSVLDKLQPKAPTPPTPPKPGQ